MGNVWSLTIRYTYESLWKHGWWKHFRSIFPSSRSQLIDFNCKLVVGNLCDGNIDPKFITVFLTRIFPHKDKIKNSFLIWENAGQRKPIFWNILSSGIKKDKLLKILHWRFCPYTGKYRAEKTRILTYFSLCIEKDR